MKACAIAVFCLFSAATSAQERRVPTWSWFLTAPTAEVAALLRPTAVDSAQALGKIVLEERRVLARHFGFYVPVSLSQRGFGSNFSRPDEGIFLDAHRLKQLRDSLPEASLRQVVRFVLAHEWGHMVQFRRLPEDTLADSARRRVIECEADMIAGSALAVLAENQGSAADFREATNSFIALAFNTGLPVWDFPWMHPNPSQRSLCITVGASAGLHWAMIRRYQATHDPEALQIVNKVRTMDRRLFGPADSIAPWFWREANAIISGIPTYPDALLAPTDFVGEVREIVRTVQFGADSIRKRQNTVSITGAKKCLVDDTASAVQVRCVWDGYASAAVAQSVFSELKDIVRPVMYEFQWHELREVVMPSGRLQTFQRTDRGATALLSFQGTTRVITATFASMK
jgi:predicted Zn-dependent protease with MMP-like domain